MEAQPNPGKAGKILSGTFVVVGLLLFVCIAIIAAFICKSQVANETAAILTRQRELQQAVLDKAMNSISVWRAELANQAKYISSSETFRLFITDARSLTPGELGEIASNDALHSENDNVRTMAEQRSYLQDLLNNFVSRRAWSEARITTPEGRDLVAQDFATPLTEEQALLIKKAVESGQQAFGPVRKGSDGLVMDLADPLFEILGSNEPKCVAALLLSVPMDKPLAMFLANPAQQKNNISCRIVDQGMGKNSVLYLMGSKPEQEPLTSPALAGPLSFEKRPGYVGREKVYSLGAELALLDWYMIVETPAAILQENIDGQRWRIYSLGAVCSLVMALVGAFAWAHVTSRKRKARVAELERLNSTIQQQKLLLDGINASLDAGLLLLDDNGIIKVANQAFRDKILQGGEDPVDAALAARMPTKAAVQLTSVMANVARDGKNSATEISLTDKAGNEHLYRVSLFPYVASPGESSSSGKGCVGIFQDITEFRQRAQVAAQRQNALLQAMDRAMESVDPNLVGDSGKMARLGQLVGKELKLTPEELETIRLAALLSQIGKLFVPRELLQKTGRLSPEEMKEVGRAPEHADRILSDMHFDLPVRETIRELNEKLDGSGPMGMTEKEISKCGRILSLLNAFVGMTSFRAWKTEPPATPAEAAQKLAANPAQFDRNAAQALLNIDRKLLMEALEGK